MNFKKWVKSIQTVGYNGARTVHYENKLTKNIRPTNIWQIYTKFDQIY